MNPLDGLKIDVNPWLPEAVKDASGKEVRLLGVLVDPGAFKDMEFITSGGDTVSLPRQSPEQAARRTVLLVRPEIEAELEKRADDGGGDGTVDMPDTGAGSTR